MRSVEGGPLSRFSWQGSLRAQLAQLASQPWFDAAIAGLAVLASVRPFNDLQPALDVFDVAAAALAALLFVTLRPTVPRFLWWLAAFAVVVTFSGLLEGASVAAMLRPGVFVAVLGLATFSRNPLSFARLTYYALAGIVALQLIGVVARFGERLDVLGPEGGPVDPRLTGWPFAVHPNESAMMAAAVLIVIAARALDRQANRFDAVGAVPALVVLAASESRTPVIALGAAVFFIWVVTCVTHTRWRTLSAGLLLVAIAVPIALGSLSSFTGERFETNDGSRLSGRTRAWSVVVDGAAADPLVAAIGVGPDGVSVPVEGIARDTQGVDNGWLVALRMGGLVGLSAVILACGSALRQLFQQAMSSVISIEAVAVASFVLVASLAQSEVSLLSPATVLFWSYLHADPTHRTDDA